MINLLPVAAPALAATVAVMLFAWRLHVLGERRLAVLERRLIESADERAAVLAATLGEELGALRRANETLSGTLGQLGRDVERLGADVVNRELYRGERPRHGDAIEAVRHGGDVPSLMREHGLPLEEAELLVSLYADADAGDAGRIRLAVDAGTEVID